ncbi:MAG: YlmC/YmxH family sporulation protein [Bacilli bacterium]|nr:YlmC/YmxH family sporulation protein [Bacilli bacterium]
MKLSDLQSKNLVNVIDGKNIGNIIDIKIGQNGSIESLIIETKSGFFSFMNKDLDLEVLWTNIVKIGEDVILVKLQ